MTNIRAPYVYTLNGNHHFRRRLGSKYLRVTLHTTDISVAQQRAATLFAYTNQLKRLGLQHRELLRLTRIRAEQLHDEALTATAFSQSMVQPAALQLAQLPVPLLATPSIQPPVPRPLLLQASMEGALRDLCRSGGTEHHRKYREAFNELALLNPATYFHEFRFAEASEHLQSLLRLPRRRTDRKPYKSMTIADVLELDTPPDQLLSATSINERMKRIARLFDWASENEAYIGSNPFRSQTLRLTEKPRERGRYTTEDLNTLFSSALFTDTEYRSGSGGRKSWWWLILLGLYSGARVGELAQLRLKDVVEVDGVLCLSINDEDGKTVKTPAAIRIVPLHPELLRLGFRNYLQHLQQKGHTHILPYPNENTDDPAQRCSKWYCGTYRIQHLPSSWLERSLVFHSFRHTFINRAIKELRLDVRMVQALVGHTPEGMAETARYAGGSYLVYDTSALISRVRYEGAGKDLLSGGWRELRLL